MKLKFPYKFRGFVQRDRFAEYTILNKVRFLPLSRLSMYLGDGNSILQNFSGIYSNLLQAMAEHDYDYLSQIMEPRLFDACKTSLEEIKEKSYKLEYIGSEKKEDGDKGSDEEAESVAAEKTDKINQFLAGPLGIRYQEDDLQIHLHAKGVFGADINRNKNTQLTRRLGDDLSTLTFYLNNNNSWEAIKQKQILVLEVFYFTKKKLILKDEDDSPLLANIEGEFYDHKLRFETYTNEIDWILCDFDNFLGSNAYFAESKPELADEEIY